MKISIDQEKCCAAGTCVTIAPEVFDQRDEDGVVILLLSDPPADLQASVREAAGVCPAMAIRLQEEA
ncbi:ferredoxin [Amycolatopsis sp. NPDC051061]|uniref:ferredoxin n=1 Tax=Amycolatopsis sp. NPDC051061 TaxID=3155042 RepID=UPI0034465E1C